MMRVAAKSRLLASRWSGIGTSRPRRPRRRSAIFPQGALA